MIKLIAEILFDNEIIVSSTISFTFLTFSSKFDVDGRPEQGNLSPLYDNFTTHSDTNGRIAPKPDRYTSQGLTKIRKKLPGSRYL